MTSLLRHELRLLLSNRASIALLLALALLTAVAVQFGITRVDGVRAAQQAAINDTRAEWRNKRDLFVRVSEGREAIGKYNDPRRADYVVLGYGQALALPPPPLAILSAGNAREGHELVEVGMRSLGRAGSASREHPANRLDGPLDVAFIAAWLLPLILILLTYDVLVRDREAGIAPLLASQRTSLRRIVVARLLVRFLMSFALVGGIVAIGVLWSSRTLPIGEVLADLALWLLALGGFTAFWLALAAAVNARARNAAGAALALLGFWLVLALLMPTVATTALDRAAPPTDRLASVLGLRALETDLTERADEVTEGYYEASPARRPIRAPFDEYEEYFVGKYYPRQVTFDTMHRPSVVRSENVAVERAMGLRRWSMASPPLALAMLTEDLAGHAPERRRWFARSARAFQDSWREVFDVKLASRRPLTIADYDRAPIAKLDRELATERRHLTVFALFSMLAAALLMAAYAARRLATARP